MKTIGDSYDTMHAHILNQIEKCFSVAERIETMLSAVPDDDFVNHLVDNKVIDKKYKRN